MAQVSELLLLAAPSCGGKTRFLDRVFAGREGDLLARMGIAGPIQSYERVLARELPQYAAACVPRMALHVCLPVLPLADGTLARIADVPMFDFVRACKRVTSLTLVAGSAVLQTRLRSRSRRIHRLLLKNIPEYLSERKRLAKLMPVYENPANLVLAYEAWLQYVESLPNVVNSWLVTSHDEYQQHTPAEWPLICESYFGSAVPCENRPRGKRSIPAVESGDCLDSPVLQKHERSRTPGSIRAAPPVRLRNACVARALDVSGMRVLDVGCAHGRYSLYLADSAREVVGIDRSRERIAVAEQTRQALGYSNVRFRLADISEPGLLGELGTFDLIIAWGFLHRIPDVFSVVHKLAEITNAFSFEWMTPVFPFMGRASIACHRGEGRSGPPAGGPQSRKSLFWCPTPFAVETIVRECGFGHTKVLGYNEGLWPEGILVLWHLARKLVRPSSAMFARVHMTAERSPGSIRFRCADLRDARLPEWDTVGRDYLERRSRDRLRFMR